jgi:hypothetical protein
MLKTFLKLFENVHNIWLIIAFIFAVGNLFLLQNADKSILILFLLPPLYAILVLGSPTSAFSKRALASLFLFCISVGIIIGPFHDILPNINKFPKLPLTQNRILSFYLDIYLLFLFAIIPPCMFVGSLLRHKQGQPAKFSKFTCYFGLFAWILLVPFLLHSLLTQFH